MLYNIHLIYNLNNLFKNISNIHIVPTLGLKLINIDKAGFYITLGDKNQDSLIRESRTYLLFF